MFLGQLSSTAYRREYVLARLASLKLPETGDIIKTHLGPSPLRSCRIRHRGRGYVYNPLYSVSYRPDMLEGIARLHAE